MLNGLFRVAYVAPHAGDILDPESGEYKPVRGQSLLLSNASGHQLNVTVIDDGATKVKVGQEVRVTISDPTTPAKPAKLPTAS